MSFWMWKKQGGIKDQGFSGTQKGIGTPNFSTTKHPSARRRIKLMGYGKKKENGVKEWGALLM